ncbi:MAG: TonB-dependent receptor [Ignavibacteriales bacterium]|nr:TonB-dependent receptor [Ignavibacteriales bacterium]
MKTYFILILLSINIIAQSYSLNGIVRDSVSSKVLKNVNIYISELNIGTSSNEYGEFSFNNLKKSNYILNLSHIGYIKKSVAVNLNSEKNIEIFLNESAITLIETEINGVYAKYRNTPIAFSTFLRQDIENRLGAKEVINILENTPGGYISQQGGGVGEQRINLRGFDQTNLAILLNGVPVNNPENGEIYWSNWAGLSDLVEFVQVQRGLSAIPYSVSSIGGSVNFVTSGINSFNSSIKFKSQFGSDNLKKISLGFFNQLSSNINLSAFISKKDAQSYIDEVYTNELTYYLSLNFIFKKHIFKIQLFGSPQKHGQRLTQLTQNDWNKYGKNYNPDWGYLNGKPLNLRDNEFHNPTLNLNYNWEIDNKLNWTNILSISHGIGGGTVPPWYPELSRTEAGQIDFQKEWNFNSNNIDPNYHSTKNRSILALRKGIHQNFWTTYISSLEYNFSDFVLSFGVDGKFYEAENYNELSNLLGGDYYIGSGNINENKSTILGIGDKVDFYAKSFTRNIGSFVQFEYKKNNFSAYINSSFSSTQYNRIDYFNYLTSDPKRETGWKNFTNYVVKFGANYNINKINNLYVNIGNFSKAPLSMNVYDYSNNLYENTKNENITSIEIGYGFQNEFSRLNLNYYYTLWNDKAFSKSFIGNDSTSIYYYNIFGASALHSGIEFDGTVEINKYITLNLMATYSLSKWLNDIDAYVRPESNPNDEIKFHSYSKDLYVGNFPMTTASIGIIYEKEISESKIFLNPVVSFYSRYYSDFDPVLRTNENEKGIQPWRLPDFYNVDLHAGYKLNFENTFIKNLNISFNIFNLFNFEKIIDATDGQTHDERTARIWYGRGRWWSSSLSFEL